MTIRAITTTTEDLSEHLRGRVAPHRSRDSRRGRRSAMTDLRDALARKHAATGAVLDAIRGEQ